MHDPACDDSDFRRWWPVGEVQEVALSGLPASGSITNPVRLVDVMRVERDGAGRVVEVRDESGAAWIGFWGPFTGLRIGYSPRNSYRISSGAAIVAPNRDLFLSVDAVNAGNASIARFHSREAALAWGQSNNEILRAGGALGPFPAASALADADPNPTTTRVGANALIFNGGTWDRWKHAVWGDNAPLVGVTPAVNAFGAVYSDRTGNYFKLRQPDSLTLRSVIQSAQSLTTTGVKATMTMAQSGRLVGAHAAVTTQTNSAGNTFIQLRITRSATVFVLGVVLIQSAVIVGTVLGASQVLQSAVAGAVVQGEGDIPLVNLLSGDVVDMNVQTAATVAGAADIGISVAEERAAF